MTLQETPYTGEQLAALTAGAHERRATAPNIAMRLDCMSVRSKVARPTLFVTIAVSSLDGPLDTPGLAVEGYR